MEKKDLSQAGIIIKGEGVGNTKKPHSSEAREEIREGGLEFYSDVEKIPLCEAIKCFPEGDLIRVSEERFPVRDEEIVWKCKAGIFPVDDVGQVEYEDEEHGRVIDIRKAYLNRPIYLKKDKIDLWRIHTQKREQILTKNLAEVLNNIGVVDVGSFTSVSRFCSWYSVGAIDKYDNRPGCRDICLEEASNIADNYLDGDLSSNEAVLELIELRLSKVLLGGLYLDKKNL